LAEEQRLANDNLPQTKVEPAEEIAALEQAVVEEKEKSEKYLANWQRAQADLVNYKKRAQQEKRETAEFGNSMLILNLLTVMDDLDRAFVSLPSRLSRSTWAQGMKLIYDKFRGILEAQGVTEIEAKGKPFDPRLHQAVMRREGEEDIVIEEVQKGYKLKDRVVRASVVVVGNGKGEKEQISQKED